MTQNEARAKCIDHIRAEREEHKTILLKFTTIALTILAASLCAFTFAVRLGGMDPAFMGNVLLVINGLNAIFYLGAAWPRLEGIRNCKLAEKHLAGYGFRDDCIALLKRYESFRLSKEI